MKHAAASLVDHLMDMNNAPEPRMPPVENLQFPDLVGVISSLCTIPRGHTPPWAAIHRPRGCANISCFVRPKGPLLRSDLLPLMTATAGRRKDAARRLSPVAFGDPCPGPPLQSHSPEEGPLPDFLNNLRSNDS